MELKLKFWFFLFEFLNEDGVDFVILFVYDFMIGFFFRRIIWFKLIEGCFIFFFIGFIIFWFLLSGDCKEFIFIVKILGGFGGVKLVGKEIVEVFERRRGLILLL